jgi:hypothetical protein
MYYPCSCADFKDEEGRWVGPAPEDVQSCSLIEWVRGRLWEVMVEEEMEEQVRQGADGRVEEEEEWEMLSNVTSQDWSVLSQDSESEMMIV